MRHPLGFSLAAAGAVLAAALALPLLHMGSGDRLVPESTDLPWAAAPQSDGSLRALGLHIGVQTLGELASRFGSELQVAVVARAREVGALEAMIDPYRAGFVSGRLVLAFAADGRTLRGWRERAPRAETTEGGAIRFALANVDRDEADRARLIGASFLPAARLTAEDIERRFGPPTTQRSLGDGVVVLGYPGIGLVVTIGGGQRSVLEFAAPRDAARPPRVAASG